MLKHILLIKTTSMGDVIHTLPAINDAVRHDANLRFHWVVEAPFADITQWHPNVVRAIPVRLRHWRKHLFSADTWQAWRAFKHEVQTQHYDAIIDAQGLIKSAYLSRLGVGPRHGFAKTCAREPLAACFYQYQHHTDPTEHAITRTRKLFANVFDYDLPELTYGLNPQLFPKPNIDTPYLIFLHGTTWETKHWPENYWCDLARLATQQGHAIQLLWGNEQEKQRAQRIAAVAPTQITVQPKLNFTEAAGLIANAKGIVAVDTGLGHMAAALGTPTISLYGPTNPKFTGTVGENQFHIAALEPACTPCLQKVCTYQKPSIEKPACFATITPQVVWQKLVDSAINCHSGS